MREKWPKCVKTAQMIHQLKLQKRVSERLFKRMKPKLKMSKNENSIFSATTLRGKQNSNFSSVELSLFIAMLFDVMELWAIDIFVETVQGINVKVYPTVHM